MRSKCVICGKPFTTYPSWKRFAGSGRYCSRVCWQKFRRFKYDLTGGKYGDGSGSRGARAARAARPKRSWPDRFWAQVIKSTNCWLWTGRRDGSLRYGRTRDGEGKMGYAHRFAWRLLRGPIPKGACLCHHCDNPLCVNPAHLFLGTRADNVRDCIAKGRHVSCRRKEGGA
jgi:hypothetical protein